MATVIFMPVADDDRVNALAWYCRRLVLDEVKKGIKQGDIGKQTNLSSAAMAQIKRGEGVGQATALKLAPYFRLEAWELWRDALAWWERVGRTEAEAELRGRADSLAAGKPARKVGRPRKVAGKSA